MVLLLSIIFSILDWLKSTCIFHLICSMYYKYASEWFVGLVLRCIPFDITTQNELNKLKCVNTFVPTKCRISCYLGNTIVKVILRCIWFTGYFRH